MNQHEPTSIVECNTGFVAVAHVCSVGGAIPFCFVGLQKANLILIWCNQEIILMVILPTGAFVCHRQNTQQPRNSNGSELYSCLVPGADPVLASGSRDRCCAGNILVESSSPQPQDTGAVQLTHLRFGLKSVGICRDTSSQGILQSAFRVLKFRDWFGVSFF